MALLGQRPRRENFIRHYDSLGEFLTEMRKPQYARTFHSENLQRGIRTAERGDNTLNAEINALVSKVSVELPSTQDQWVADIAGACPIVPMAIAGLPDNMLRLEKVETTGVPLRIFVSVGLSAGVDNAAVRQRGIAIIALLEHVSARRNVELHLYDDSGGYGYMVGPVVRVQSTPLDTAMLAGVLADPDFERALCFPFLSGNVEGGVGWAFGMSPTVPECVRLTRLALGANPDDLLIVGAYLDQVHQIMRDPVGWVREQVALTENRVGEE